MSKDVLGAFHENLSRAIAERGISRRQLSLEIGRQPGYIADLLRAPGTAPGIDVAARIAEALEITLADLLTPTPRDPAEQSRHRSARELLAAALDLADRRLGTPAVPEIEDILRAQPEALADPAGLGRFVEIFDPPDTAGGLPHPIAVGRQSLAAREIGFQSPGELATILELSDPKLADELSRDHLTALETARGMLSEHEIDLTLANHRIRVRYVRLLLPHLHQGRRRIVHYSKAVWRAQVSSDKKVKAAPIKHGQAVLARP